MWIVAVWMPRPSIQPRYPGGCAIVVAVITRQPKLLVQLVISQNIKVQRWGQNGWSPVYLLLSPSISAVYECMSRISLLKEQFFCLGIVLSGADSYYIYSFYLCKFLFVFVFCKKILIPCFNLTCIFFFNQIQGFVITVSYKWVKYASNFTFKCFN